MSNIAETEVGDPPLSFPRRLGKQVQDRFMADANSRESALAALKVLIIRCAGAAIAYGVQVLLSRLLGQSDYGVFALVWVWIIVLGHLTPVGIAQAACRFIPHYHARDEQALLRGFIKTGALFVTLFSCATALLCSAFLWGAASFVEDIYFLPFALALFVVPLFALQDYVENVARSFNWTLIAIAPPYIIRHGLIACGLGSAFMLNWEITAALAIALTFGAALLSLLLQTGLVWWRLRAQMAPGPSETRAREWLRTALPLVFVDGTVLLFSNADILILSLFVEPATVALYFAASRILQLVGFVQYAAAAATTQRFSALNAQDDRSALSALAKSTTQLTFIVSLCAVGFIYPLAPTLLSLFGGGFGEAMPILSILMFGLLVQAFAGPGEDLLKMLGEERVCASLSVIALLLNVGLNFALIPAFGAEGAAIATVLSLSFQSLGLTWLVQKRLGLSILFSLPMRGSAK